MQKSVGMSGDPGACTTSRRRFMAGAGLTALGLYGTSTLSGVEALSTVGSDAVALSQNDVDILNFALNIEYLGAEFYLRAVFGQGLDDSDVDGDGNQGNVDGGSAVPFQSGFFRDVAEEIARNEQAHVRFLRSTLGQNAVARPAIDLADAFTNAARVAGVIGPGETFDPFADEVSFWLGAFMLEDVDVTAYKGASRLLQNKTIVEASAGILAVEGYHAGSIRTILFSMGQYRAPRLISNLRDVLDGPDDRDQPIRVQGHANIVPTDANGLAFSRTPRQVLNIAYMGGAAADFGFFPNRVNGAIR